MATVLNINIDDLDSQFIGRLKEDFAHAAIEIRLQEQPGQSVPFTETDFWGAIDLLAWNESIVDDLVVEPLIAFLSEQPISHIYRFADILSQKLWLLDTYAHAKVFLGPLEHEEILSVDDFLYTRCAVVANGKNYYENVLENPQLMPTDLGFEPLLYVALKAYKRKTGKDFTPVFAYNYETYSNKKGWESQES
ncbi:MAG: DUF4240 domain-containing protein [Saprospiraceae bacterium]|nr:DUF4240 domain-containing protein [Saprospiraceae bacterium]